MVAAEGFAEKKHYWEVEVGDSSEWELGVVGEGVRDALRSNAARPFPTETLFSLRFSAGGYRLAGGKELGNGKPCGVVGLLLDRDLGVLSFFGVEERRLLESLRVEGLGILYPFFRPGSGSEPLGVRPVSTYPLGNVLPWGRGEVAEISDWKQSEAA